MYVLNELWRGNISPAERFVRSGSAYKETAKKLSDEMDRLMRRFHQKPESRLRQSIICGRI